MLKGCVYGNSLRLDLIHLKKIIICLEQALGEDQTWSCSNFFQTTKAVKCYSVWYMNYQETLWFFIQGIFYFWLFFVFSNSHFYWRHRMRIQLFSPLHPCNGQGINWSSRFSEFTGAFLDYSFEFDLPRTVASEGSASFSYSQQLKLTSKYVFNSVSPSFRSFTAG